MSCFGDDASSSCIPFFPTLAGVLFVRVLCLHVWKSVLQTLFVSLRVLYSTTRHQALFCSWRGVGKSSEIHLLITLSLWRLGVSLLDGSKELSFQTARLECGSVYKVAEKKLTLVPHTIRGKTLGTHSWNARLLKCLLKFSQKCLLQCSRYNGSLSWR